MLIKNKNVQLKFYMQGNTVTHVNCTLLKVCCKGPQMCYLLINGSYKIKYMCTSSFKNTYIDRCIPMNWTKWKDCEMSHNRIKVQECFALKLLRPRLPWLQATGVYEIIRSLYANYPRTFVDHPFPPTRRINITYIMVLNRQTVWNELDFCGNKWLLISTKSIIQKWINVLCILMWMENYGGDRYARTHYWISCTEYPSSSLFILWRRIL